MLGTIWVILLIAGVFLLLASLFMALYWRVLSLADEISGKKAKRQIARLREYNSTTGEMTAISTGELELMLAGGGGGSLLAETVTKVDTKVKSLKDMIDDPYGSVGKGAVKPVNKLPVEQEYVVEEGVTGLLSDVELGMLSKKSIIILDEQSSI